MEDITTIDLQKYIKKKLSSPETERQEIWLHNLPENEELFNIIELLRKEYNNETFVITQNINITNEKINKEINFSNCIFQENVNLSNCIFYKNSTFSYIKNKQGEIIANATIFQKEVNFFRANFKESVNFSGCNFNLKANFSETIFGIKKEDNNSDESSSEVKFLIENAKFQKEINFSKAIFYDAIYFSGTDFCTDIKDYAKESINFENAQFKRKVRFHHCKFHNTVRFENTSFNKLVDFYCAHFYKPQQFHFTDFLDRAIFSNTEFHEEVQFLHCKVDNSYVRFESATFKKGLDISRSNFNDKVNFWNIEIEESGEQYIFNNLKSVKYVNDFEVQDKTPTIYKQFRETYRIIKDNFYSQNNKIEGLKFYEKEMSVYLEEKRAEDKNTKQSKKKNKSLTSNSKANIITNSNKINFNNIKKKYLNTYNFLDLLFAIGLSFIIVCFSVIYPLFWFLRKAIHLFAQKVSYKDLKNSMKKIINNKNFYLYIKIFIRICFNRLISLKNNNFFLFIVTFLTIIFILGIMYIVQHKYIWYWFFVFLIILLFYIISYQNRKIIKSNIKSNNYISLVLLSIPSIIILVIFYGINNYKNDWIYRLLNYLSIQFSIIVKDEQIFSFILTIISIITAIVLAIISNKQDKLLLWFNKNSNIFGTDWVVGINFTILVTLVAYIIILYSSPNLLFLPNLEGVGNFLKGLVDILNLTDWNDITILGEKLTTWQYIFLFIGRIFVAYGVYQTVQAFRKFGKS